MSETVEKPRWVNSGIQIIGYGHSYPGVLIENEDLPTLRMGSVDQSVIGALDVRSRYVSGEDDDIVELAYQAAKNALEDAEVSPKDLDLLIFSNWSDRQFVPEQAPRIATRLNASRAFAFNICGACSGFVNGIQQASAYLSTSIEDSIAIVVSADRFSRRVRPGSKGELIVGDASGAVVMRKSPGCVGLLDTVLRSDGRYYDATAAWPPLGYVRSKPELVHLALKSNLWSVNKLLKRNNISLSDLSWLIPHPGTSAVNNGLKNALNFPEERFVTNFEVRGNTGSASVPIVLSEMRQDGRLQPNDLVMILAVGSGWFYGGGLYHV